MKLDEFSEVTVAQRKENNKKKSGTDTWFYLGFIGEIGYTIAIPITGGTLVGVWIDRTWLTYPKATLLLLFLGCIVSVLGMVRVIKEVIRDKN